MVKERIQELMDFAESFMGHADPNDPKERRRQKIMNAASELFIQHGYRKTSMDDVAKRAGVAKGTVYLYFKNKSDLLMHAIAEEKMRFMSGIFEILKGDDPPQEKLRKWLRTALVLVTEMPLLSRLMGGDHEILMVVEEMNTDLKDQSEELKMAFMHELIDTAAAPHRWTSEELDDRARVIFGFFYFAGLLANEQVRGELSVERFASILADIMVDGLASRSSHDGSSQIKGVIS